jgi:hypothetical protein
VVLHFACQRLFSGATLDHAVSKGHPPEAHGGVSSSVFRANTGDSKDAQNISIGYRLSVSALRHDVGHAHKY